MRKETDIFKYHDLTDFEKNLFLEKQVKDLTKLSRKLFNENKIYKERIADLESNTYESDKNRRQKENINGLNKRNQLLLKEIHDLNYMLSNGIGDKKIVHNEQLYWQKKYLMLETILNSEPNSEERNKAVKQWLNFKEKDNG